MSTRTKPKASPNGRPAIERPLEAFKVICQPVYCIRNEQGDVVREVMVEGLTLTLWQPEFDKLRGLVDEQIPQVQQAMSQPLG